MVLHFYSAFTVYWLLKVLYNTCHIHPFTHTFIHWWQMLPRKVPAAHQEQFGVQYLAQGHFNMQLGGAGIQTSDLPITYYYLLSYNHPKWRRSNKLTSLFGFSLIVTVVIFLFYFLDRDFFAFALLWLTFLYLLLSFRQELLYQK